MKSKYFIQSGLKKQIEKNIEKREKINIEIKKNLEAFYDEVNKDTIYAIMDNVLSNGHPHQQNMISAIRERYESCSLLIDDTLILLDLYEKEFDDISSKKGDKDE